MGIRDIIEKKLTEREKNIEKREAEEKKRREEYYKEIKRKAKESREELKRLKEIKKAQKDIDAIKKYKQYNDKDSWEMTTEGIDNTFSKAFSFDGNASERKKRR